MHDPTFRRTIGKLVADKYDGDIYAYIKNLHETIDAMEALLKSMNDAFLNLKDIGEKAAHLNAA